MEFQNEKAVDSECVSREVYSVNFTLFKEMFPEAEKQWQAVGLWLKGLVDHNVIPVRLLLFQWISIC